MVYNDNKTITLMISFVTLKGNIVVLKLHHKSAIAVSYSKATGLTLMLNDIKTRKNNTPYIKRLTSLMSYLKSS